ncbi:MAG: prepilin-type N-terminal cleavage/methylation domain-containing protein [Candidatus Roizmanbacteria bacterium]|nr:prepilin-type N-terminal cleavage/methylation domain-containing protein [Candidatus Roizmanbacteria bacterium]
MVKRLNVGGFTLIELIVVIGIIGILATIGMSSYANIQKKAKETKVASDLKEIKKAIESARITTGQTLGQITGNYCSACSTCWGAGDLRKVPDSHLCAVRWLNAVTTISTKGLIGVEDIRRDSWGSPYWLDENDGEYAGNLCRIDTIASPGPDGIAGTADDIYIRLKPISAGC